ncbi:MAG: FtsQ-type POTRA domain-containing protein [Limisphaera sp.]
MWSWRPKARNRRLGREHLLDVKLRSSVVRAARARLVAGLLAGAFGLGVGMYAVWRAGAWLQNCLFYENPRFTLHRVEVSTDGVLSVEQLRRWAGVRPGVNLLALDLAQVKRSLEMVPYVASVSVERVLPDTLRLRVTERRPVARIQVPLPVSPGGVDFVTYHVDGEGVVLPPLDPRLMSEGAGMDSALPLLRGLNYHDLQPGRRVEHASVQAALGWLRAFAQSPMAGLAEVRELALGAGVLEVLTGEGSRITFGLEDFERQLLRWREIHEAGWRQQRQIETLDLAVGNNIPVRWKAPESEPEPSPPRRPNTVSRKHV